MPKLVRAAALVAILASPIDAADSPNAWKTLADLRQHLGDRGAIAADFVQTYLPSGFTSGDQERGHLALALPNCLRWDYDQPYARSVLLCGADAYAWNQGETSGRHFRVEAKDETGLDLLLLPMEALRTRYEAQQRTRTDGGVDVVLTPKGEAVSPLEATLSLVRSGKEIAALAYTDPEGNLSRFEITGYRALSDRTLFSPPHLRWQEQ